jgi:hypothetical protein
MYVKIFFDININNKLTEFLILRQEKFEKLFYGLLDMVILIFHINLKCALLQ